MGFVKVVKNKAYFKRFQVNIVAGEIARLTTKLALV